MHAKNAYVKKPPKKMKEKDNYYSSQKQTNKKRFELQVVGDIQQQQSKGLITKNGDCMTVALPWQNVRPLAQK